jgi:hypothetical protein
VFLDGVPRILTLGSGHLYTDDTVKPAGTIDPTLNYIFTPQDGTGPGSRFGPGPRRRRRPL